MGIQGETVFDTISSSNISALSSSVMDDFPSRKQAIIAEILPLLETRYGLMSIASNSNRYHQSGYHTGNIWLFDTMFGALGLLKSGNENAAKRLAEKVISVVEMTNLYPEFVGLDGNTTTIIDVLDIKDNRRNRISQPGQPLQGWSVLAYLLALSITRRQKLV
jgi:glycogen debranching enzyme